MNRDGSVVLGSARGSRAGGGALAIANFLEVSIRFQYSLREDVSAVAPKCARKPRALPRMKACAYVTALSQ